MNHNNSVATNLKETFFVVNSGNPLDSQSEVDDQISKSYLYLCDHFVYFLFLKLLHKDCDMLHQMNSTYAITPHFHYL